MRTSWPVNVLKTNGIEYSRRMLAMLDARRRVRDPQKTLVQRAERRDHCDFGDEDVSIRPEHLEVEGKCTGKPWFTTVLPLRSQANNPEIWRFAIMQDHDGGQSERPFTAPGYSMERPTAVPTRMSAISKYPTIPKLSCAPANLNRKRTGCADRPFPE
jgi:hypothetical protein